MIPAVKKKRILLVIYLLEFVKLDLALSVVVVAVTRNSILVVCKPLVVSKLPVANNPYALNNFLVVNNNPRVVSNNFLVANNKNLVVRYH